MANLVVRNDCQALKERAGRSGHSAEAEHRLILAQALLKPKKRSFSEILADMPDVGRDSDFERVQETGEVDVFAAVTRNIGDFSSTGVRLMNPFTQH